MAQLTLRRSNVITCEDVAHWACPLSLHSRGDVRITTCAVVFVRHHQGLLCKLCRKTEQSCFCFSLTFRTHIPPFLRIRFIPNTRVMVTVRNQQVDIPIGTMMELPRACQTADDIVNTDSVKFMSFGTNVGFLFLFTLFLVCNLLRACYKFSRRRLS